MNIDRWCAGINARITGSAHLIQELSHLRASEFPTPKTYAEAMKGDFAKWWREAIHEEIQNLTDHGTFEWVKPPSSSQRAPSEGLSGWDVGIQGQIE